MACIHLSGAAFDRVVGNLTVRGGKGRVHRPVVYANATTQYRHPTGGAYHTAGVRDEGFSNGQGRVLGAVDGVTVHLR